MTQIYPATPASAPSSGPHVLLIINPLYPSPEAVLPFLRSRLAKKPSSNPHRDDDQLDEVECLQRIQAFDAGVNVEEDLDAEAVARYEILYRPLIDGPGKGQLGKANPPNEAEWKKAEAVLGFMPPKDLKSVEQTPELKFWQLGSAGWGHLDNSEYYNNLPKSSEMIWASASGIHVVPIAEHVIATAMSLYHNFPKFILAGREHPPRWIRMPELGRGGFVVKELRNRTMGVLGYGHIGRECARMANALGMRVIAANRKGEKQSIGGYLVKGTGDHNGDIPSAWYATESADSMREFYSKSDVVVNTLPSNSATRGFVSADSLRQMKNDALFVNIGRGDTVDQEALIQALKAGLDPQAAALVSQEEDAKKLKQDYGQLQIGSASLDVTTPEPLEPENELWSLENVLLTPHMSGGSELYWLRATDLFAKNVKRVLEEGKGALNAFRGRGEDQ